MPALPPGPDADQAALARLGDTVRARLEADPAAWRVPGDRAEIYALADFLTGAECDRFIAMIDDAAYPSRVLDHGYAGVFRTSSSCDVDPRDPFVMMIERRIDDLLGIDHAFGETIQGQRYEIGQEFKKHCDWLHTGASYWQAEAERGGQRSWTAMIYLNDVADGGQTNFVNLGVTVPPQRGALLTWNNARPDGLINVNTLHAALPVVQGVKHVITKWYRTRKWG
ncbi:MAG: 2OG-Fe(II) oxygenase [Sphingomonadales bacterium]|nr:2OG-Fe(II) oxygenase [Sphingomonadales bacterium]